jgi:hypothetical protein
MAFSVNEELAKDWKDYHVVEFDGLEVKVKDFLSFEEFCMAYESVLSVCFPDGDFYPPMREFGIKSVLINIYTNLALPEDFNELFIAVSSIDVDRLLHLDKVSFEQFRSLIETINSGIEHNIMMSANGSKKEIEELLSSLKNIAKMYQELYEGINTDDLNNLISALGENGIDEEKIVKAILSNKEDDHEGVQ